MNSLEGSHCYALEDNILTSLNMFFNASRISKQCCADLHVPAKKSNETKHNPSHFNRARSLLRFINIQKWTSEIYLKSQLQWERENHRARDGRAGKKPHFYGIGFILPNSFYKSFTLALNNTLFHVCILNLFNPSQKCHVSNTVESYLSSAVPEIQKKILTILPFQISRKYYF